MSGCLALSRKWRVCCNYASVIKNSDGTTTRGITCIKHTEFFNNQEEIKMILFDPRRGGYAHYSHICSWISKWLESCLMEGLIKITQEDISKIITEGIRMRITPKWAYFLLLYARSVKEFRYSWNPILWEKSVTTLWHWTRRIGPVEITKKDLQLLLCVKGSIFEFYRGIELAMEELNDDEWYSFFEECCASCAEWFEYFVGIPIEEHKKYVKGVTATLRYTAWLLTKKSRFFKKCSEKLSIFKQEIMAVSWHPSRFQKWALCKEEYEGLSQRWYNPQFAKTNLKNVLEEVCVITVKN